MVSYKEAGVNIEEGYKSVDLIKTCFKDIYKGSIK